MKRKKTRERDQLLRDLRDSLDKVGSGITLLDWLARPSEWSGVYGFYLDSDKVLFSCFEEELYVENKISKTFIQDDVIVNCSWVIEKDKIVFSFVSNQSDSESFKIKEGFELPSDSNYSLFWNREYVLTVKDKKFWIFLIRY